MAAAVVAGCACVGWAGAEGRAAPAGEPGPGPAWPVGCRCRADRCRRGCRGRGPGGCRDRRRRRSWRGAGPRSANCSQRRCGRWRSPSRWSGCRCCASSDGRAARGDRRRRACSRTRRRRRWSRSRSPGGSSARASRTPWRWGSGSTRPRRPRSSPERRGRRWWARRPCPGARPRRCATSPRTTGRDACRPSGARSPSRPSPRTIAVRAARARAGTVTRAVVVPETKIAGARRPVLSGEAWETEAICARRKAVGEVCSAVEAGSCRRTSR